ncbi:MAG TPA: hypothetical protein VN643_07045 [Pyrinomonadaceae bacterium]|nr:hypothetical protein [Pyrinomonadaceae bacterium]
MSFTRIAAFCLLLTLPFLAVSRPASSAKNALVVHEWGTFTSVTSKEGSGLSWRPLSFESDLPSFIYSVDKGESWKGGYEYRTKSATPVRVRMETPVLYFYSKEEMLVNVKVGFNSGIVTEWYPQARSVSRGIDWGQLKIVPDLRVELPHDARQNHYYPARETDAAILEVPGEKQAEHEKFLFYRGVGNFRLPLWLKIQGAKVVISNLSTQPLAKAILFENRAGQIGFSLLDVNRPETTVDRPATGKQLDSLRAELKTILMSQGLYEKEADAMLNTWRDSWYEEGLRLFYIIPQADTDRILPLTIDPQPAGIVRVLVGRSELITPEAETNVTSQLQKLSDPSEAVRERARKEINRYGRFIESILAQISSHTTDPKVQSAAQRLMVEIN